VKKAKSVLLRSYDEPIRSAKLPTGVNIIMTRFVHKDGDHVLYIVSGQGSMMHGTQTIALKPGMVVHIPKGEVHSIKAQGGELTLLDFAQPPFKPDQMEGVK
jgi:mannose-6-phosphate isomerase-like protein (cupin superfamily)